MVYEMMEAAWRVPAPTEVRPDWMPPWMTPFARTIDAKKKYVVSSTLDRVDWNAELVRGDLENAVQQLKRESVDIACVAVSLANISLVNRPSRSLAPSRPQRLAGAHAADCEV
jgi:hypothetical protein